VFVPRKPRQEIQRLLDDLPNVSRIARGKLQLKRKPGDLVEILELARQQSRGVLEKLGQHLTLSLPPGPVPDLADTTRLQQVFANLLNNGSRYSGPGTAIALEASCRDNTAEVRVRDNGIGMAGEDLERIFEPFFQAGANERTGSPSRAGLGLGLALAHSLVKMHGGTIEARSEGPGRGSEFVIRLPINNTVSAEPPRGTARRPRAKPKSPRRLLLIDDNRQITYSLERLLTRRGYQVEVAHTGEEGIRAAQRNVPDVVVLDIDLPDLDGYEVARHLRELPALSGARLIALSGYGSEHDRQRSREAGIDAHLVKPVRLNSLEAAIGTR
jgi:CheY-like chemotaxis protein